MIATAKSFIPFILYAGILLLSLSALSGKTRWALWLLIFLMPFRNVIDRLHRFPLGHDLIDIMLIALIIGTMMQSLVKKEKMFEKSPINPIAILLIIYTFVSLIWGSSFLHSYLFFDISDPRVQAWKNFCILPLLFFITLNNIKKKKDVWITVAVMCFAMILMDLYVSQQISWYQNVILSRIKIHGTFVYLGPNEVAAFFNMYTVLLLGLYLCMKRSINKLILLGIILCNSFCIIFLFSRAAYVGFAAGLFVLFAIKNKKLLIPLILIGIFWQVALPERVQERILMTTDDYGELDPSSASRLVVWDQALGLFSDSPIIGVGFGVFRNLDYRLGDTHNIFIKILVEQGIIGLFIFLLLIFIMFVQGIKLFTGGDDRVSQGLGLGFSMCIIVLLVNNMFGDRWTYMELSAYFWVFAGLVARLNSISNDANQNRIIPNNKVVNITVG